MSKKKIARILLVLAVVASLTLMELTPLSMVQDASAVTQADIDKLKDELSGMNSEKSQLERSSSPSRTTRAPRLRRKRTSTNRSTCFSRRSRALSRSSASMRR